jgi:hypothetical protein
MDPTYTDKIFSYLCQKDFKQYKFQVGYFLLPNFLLFFENKSAKMREKKYFWKFFDRMVFAIE